MAKRAIANSMAAQQSVPTAPKTSQVAAPRTAHRPSGRTFGPVLAESRVASDTAANGTSFNTSSSTRPLVPSQSNHPPLHRVNQNSTSQPSYDANPQLRSSHARSYGNRLAKPQEHPVGQSSHISYTSNTVQPVQHAVPANVTQPQHCNHLPNLAKSSHPVRPTHPRPNALPDLKLPPFRVGGVCAAQPCVTNPTACDSRRQSQYHCSASHIFIDHLPEIYDSMVFMGQGQSHRRRLRQRNARHTRRRKHSQFAHGSTYATEATPTGLPIPGTGMRHQVSVLPSIHLHKKHS